MARKPEKSGIDSRSLQMRDIQFRSATPLKLDLSASEVIQHDTIHRAWQLFLRRRREAREGELERQFHRMSLACSDLAQHDPVLFRGSMVKDKKRKFPVEMRALTETPAKKGWDYAWTAPVVEPES